MTTHHHYDDGTHRFDYTITLKPRMKHRYIRIRKGSVIVTAPLRTPIKQLEALVSEKADWIANHLQNPAERPPVNHDLTDPSAQIYWRGVAHPVVIHTGAHYQLQIDEGHATFTLPHPPTHDIMAQMLQHHYKHHAPSILLPFVHRWSEQMGLHPTHVSFRRARTRWGSCSSADRISLNIAMLMLPDPLIDYIVVHELAHIEHKNHSRSFWDLVAQFIPDWKTRRKAIRQYEPYLDIFFAVH